MDEDFELREKEDLFEKKALSLTDGGWKCLQIESPAGTWFLVSEKGLFEKYSARKNGKRRAVFTRAEMHRANPVLEHLSQDARQQWLGDMIKVKEAFEGAIIQDVKGTDS